MLKTRFAGRSIRVAVALISVVCLVVAFSSAIQAAPGFTVTYVSATYDPGTGQTTFKYRVTAEGMTNGMSHWSLEACTDPTTGYYVDGSGSGTGSDPAARVTEGITWGVETGTWTEGSPPITIQGIRWLDPTGSCGGDCTLGDGGVRETDEFTYALTGNWEALLGPVAYSIKFAGNYSQGWTIGPDCSGTPTAVTLSSFAANPSAGGLASPLLLGLIGTVLAAGSLFWTKRRTG